MVPVDRVTDNVDREPARHVGWLRIGVRIRFEQHRLFVQAAYPHADDGLAVAVMIVPELGELLAGNEEGRLAVGGPFLRFGQFERGFAYLLESVAHRFTKPRKTLG